MNASIIHIIHFLAAGIWLGGLVFTASVVSPAFKRMNWAPTERIAVRSEVGRQYSKIAHVNLAILLLSAIFDASARNVWEIALIVFVCAISELHALVFAPRLGAAARSGNEIVRRKTLRVSIGVSVLNLVFSFVIAILAIGGRA